MGQFEGCYLTNDSWSGFLIPLVPQVSAPPPYPSTKSLKRKPHATLLRDTQQHSEKWVGNFLPQVLISLHFRGLYFKVMPLSIALGSLTLWSVAYVLLTSWLWIPQISNPNILEDLHNNPLKNSWRVRRHMMKSVICYQASIISYCSCPLWWCVKEGKWHNS